MDGLPWLGQMLHIARGGGGGGEAWVTETGKYKAYQTRSIMHEPTTTTSKFEGEVSFFSSAILQK